MSRIASVDLLAHCIYRADREVRTSILGPDMDA
jgi:hypothetical protein